MGRAGIRRRTPRRRLPPVESAGWPEDDIPPVMWSPPGSGFEASPFSPAGRAQTFHRFTRSASRRGQPKWVRITLWAVVALVVGPVVAQLVMVVATAVR